MKSEQKNRNVRHAFICLMEFKKNVGKFKKQKIITFKNDRGFASESKVCNEGCNEQNNEMIVTAEH